MTKTQKRKHVESLKAIVESKGFKIDRYGNYKLESNNELFRIKFKKINIRFERCIRINNKNEWFKIFSSPCVKIDSYKLETFLNKRIK